jgi:serine kinase of HPr protein (carbohydrate metabolism regulator)
MKLQAPLHATFLATGAGRAQRGVLLTGPSGAGKSTLALALIGRSFRLVADDRVVIWRSEGRLFGRAPSALEGLLEIRGVGVVCMPHLAFARIDLMLEAAVAGENLERCPSPATTKILGADLPKLRLDLAAWGACDKVIAALRGQPV